VLGLVLQIDFVSKYSDVGILRRLVWLDEAAA